MHKPQPKQPKKVQSMQVRMSYVLKEQSVRYVLTSTDRGFLGIGYEKKLEKKLAEIYQELRKHHIPIELALAVYSCFHLQGLVRGLIEQVNADSKTPGSINNERVQELIPALLNVEPEKSKEVLRCFNAWWADAKSPESVSFEFTPDLRDSILERVDILQDKIHKKLSIKEATKFLNYKKSDEKHSIDSPQQDPRKSPGSTKQKH